MNVSSALASPVTAEPVSPYSGSPIPVCAVEMDRADSNGPAKSIREKTMTKTRENAQLVRGKADKE
jgi:hypothetical protein